MPLPKPDLDNRTFQDIVDEAKKRIARISPEWTDHNVSDPGITLIELFAWMTEMLIYRLNQVPARSQITFMELMGITLEPPVAARAPITFRLTFPLHQGDLPYTIPAGTEVMTRQRPLADRRNGTVANGNVPSHTGEWAAESTDMLIFTTERAAEVHAPEPAAPFLLLVDAKEEAARPRKDERIIRVFSAKPVEGESFWLGFTSNLGDQVIAIEIAAEFDKGTGIDPDNPPLVWEAWCLNGWRTLTPDEDTVRGLNQPGRVVLLLPTDMCSGHALADTHAPGHTWLRCVFRKHDAKQDIYSQSPEIRTIKAAGVGVTVEAVNTIMVDGELLGYSDGTPGQRFPLAISPVLPTKPGDKLQVQDAKGSWDDWSAALENHFGRSDEQSLHFLLDHVAGEIAFGPQIRQPDGSVRQYGAIPPRGRAIRMSRYRIGGGSAGNVPAGALTELRRAISYVEQVKNHSPARGGRDAESIDRAKLRAPQQLRTGFRAVTAEDYEHLAREYLRRELPAGVTRVHCIQPSSAEASAAPGPIRLLLVPSVEVLASEPLAVDRLSMSTAICDRLKAHLDKHRLLTSVLLIEAPKYVEVSVVVQAKALTQAQRASVSKAIEERLYRYLNPISGGNPHGEGAGWPFGRSLYMADLISLLQTVPGLEYIEWLTMQTAGDKPIQGPIRLQADQLFVSGRHEVKQE